LFSLLPGSAWDWQVRRVPALRCCIVGGWSSGGLLGGGQAGVGRTGEQRDSGTHNPLKNPSVVAHLSEDLLIYLRILRKTVMEWETLVIYWVLI